MGGIKTGKKTTVSIAIVCVIVFGFILLKSGLLPNLNDITINLPNLPTQVSSIVNNTIGNTVVSIPTMQNSQPSSKAVIYNNSVWPCSLKSDVSGKIDVNCYTSGLYHFNNPSINNLEISQVRLSWNDAGNYKAIDQTSYNENEYDLGKLISKETSSEPQSGSSQQIPSVSTSQQQSEVTKSPQTQTIQPNLDELRNYALQLINEDRTKNSLSPVKLSNNQAAQIHAEDMLKTGTLSHYMTTGEKPYIAYTRFNGLGHVSQNAAGGILYADVQGCINGIYICDPIDPKEEIQKSEYDMMYNDSGVKIPWGHRDNILDKHHTDVSIGIAYDKYSFFMIQNFEDNYIDYSLPMSENNGIVTFVGNLKSGSLDGIGIYYDPLPTSYTYQQHKDDGFYEMGEQIATVEQPPQGNLFYPPSNHTFEIADQWIQQGNRVNIAFDISPFVNNSGVYTIVAYLKDNGDSFPVTSYSITKNIPMVQQGFKSSKIYYACTQDQINQFNQLQQQYDLLLQQYNGLPKTATSDQEYQHDMQLYNQLNSMEKQIENFRC